MASKHVQRRAASSPRQLLEQGFADAAARRAEEVLKIEPANVDAMLVLAHVWRTRRRPSMADALLRKCHKICPGDMSISLVFAENLFDQGCVEEAVAMCDRVLAREPDRHEFRRIKAMSQQRIGNHIEAIETLEPMLRPPNAQCGAIEVAGKSLHGLGRFDEAIALMRPFADDLSQTPSDRRKLWLQIARTLDRLDRPDQAMKACEHAHALVPSKYDSSRYIEYVDSIIDTFSAKNLRALSRSNNQSDLPVFIVGMPRSGTTLIEQIIHAHASGFGVGEYPYLAGLGSSIGQESGSIYGYPQSLFDLSSEQANQVADEYVAHLRELAQPRSPNRIVNKALQQHEHIGLIWQVLPRSRIINIRRNPLDTCLSCYMHELSNPAARDLAHLGVAYRQYRRLMDHWTNTLDLRVLDVEYETLVRQSEDEIRRIIGFLELPWDERCLRYWETDRAVMTHSHEQVNKPIYDSSIGRWRKYEQFLGPLVEALGDENAPV